MSRLYAASRMVGVLCIVMAAVVTQRRRGAANGLPGVTGCLHSWIKIPLHQRSAFYFGGQTDNRWSGDERESAFAVALGLDVLGLGSAVGAGRGSVCRDTLLDRDLSNPHQAKYTHNYTRPSTKGNGGGDDSHPRPPTDHADRSTWLQNGGTHET